MSSKAVKIVQNQGLQTLYPGVLGLFLVISLWACQNPQSLERAVPVNALAVLNLKQKLTHLPFLQVQWRQILMPLAKNKSGILYLGNHEETLSIASLKGSHQLPSTQWKGIHFEHFRDERGQNWTLTQLKSCCFLSKEAALVEEAARNYQQGKRANWVKPLLANTLQLNYEAVSDFYELSRENTVALFESFTLQLETPKGQQNGMAYLTRSFQQEEKDLTAVLAMIPASVRYFSPGLPHTTRKELLEPLKGRTGFTLHFGRGNQRQSALLLVFDQPAQAQRASQQLAENKGALPALDYQTYSLQPILDLGLSIWPSGQATLLVQDRFLIITSSQPLMERWIDALVVENTVARQLRQPPRGLWMRFEKDSGLGLALNHLQNAFALDLNLPDMLQWEGTVKDKKWSFSTAANLETTPSNTAQLWQMDLPSGTVRQLWSVEAWGQCLVESSENHLLLLDLEGNVQWDKKLEGPIVGALNPVYDPALQQTILYFATEKAIHAFNAQGQELPAYPLALNLSTSSGLSVGGREQFLFYTSADGRIYGLNKTGQPLSGWNPGPRIGMVRQPLAFFQSATADYLLVLNEEGDFYALDRATQLHFPSQKFPGPFLSPPQWQWDSYGERMVVANGQGKAQVFNAQGEFFPLALGTGTAAPTQLCFVDLIGDKRKDYLAAQSKHLFLHAYVEDKYQLVFQKEFKGAIAKIGAIEGRILLAIPDLHEVWALSAEGKILEGFPVAGDLFAGFGKERVVLTGVGERVYGWAW